MNRFAYRLILILVSWTEKIIGVGITPADFPVNRTIDKSEKWEQTVP
jgi:hypothetical protein